MKIFHSASDEELLVADILTDLPRMIFIHDQSPSAIHESSILPKNWACKRTRSSSSSASMIYVATALAAMRSFSSLLPLSPEPITAIAPPLPSKFRVSGGVKRRIRVCAITVAKTSDDGLHPPEQNPRKKTRREELSENLSKVSQQRIAVAEGVEDAMQLYERVKAYELQLAEKEKELKLCLEQELEACEKLPHIG